MSERVVWNSLQDTFCEKLHIFWGELSLVYQYGVKLEVLKKAMFFYKIQIN